MLILVAFLGALVFVGPTSVVAVVVAWPEARTQVLGAAEGKQRFSEILGRKRAASVSHIYAQGRGDRFSGYGRYRFQFQVADLGAARKLLSDAGFVEGGEWEPSPFLTSSPEEFPILWLPLASSDQLQPFHGPKNSRAWLDPVTYTVYMDVDRFLRPDGELARLLGPGAPWNALR